MDLLHNAVRPYAWGSRTVLAELRGHPTPAPHPEAELWMGAHPGDPSRIVDGNGNAESLLDVVGADPVGQLGSETAQRWDEQLPFLMKILAAEEPLSMQAHPAAAEAAAGYAREEAAGIRRDAPERNYPDPTAKPELVCSLTGFEVLAGFAECERIVALLRAIETAELSGYVDLLAQQPDADGLRALFTTWITLPQHRLDTVLPEVLDACARHAAAEGPFATECRTVLELGRAHPHDAGVLAALLLNRISLAPGDAMYLPPGNLHVYLRGAAVEVLANSDNILRGGLTPKHVDVPELLRVVDFERGPIPVLRGEPSATSDRMRVYRTDAAEFELSRVWWESGDVADVPLPDGTPQILVCTHGAAELACHRTGEVLPVARGAAAWLPANHSAVTLRPAAAAEPVQVFRATPGSAGAAAVG